MAGWATSRRPARRNIYRDARIAPIYEGTNGIQANDLVGRKLGRDGGEAARELFAEMRPILAEIGGRAGWEAMHRGLAEGLDALERATAYLVGAEPALAAAGSSPYLALFGTVVGGWLMARLALAAERGAGDARVCRGEAGDGTDLRRAFPAARPRLSAGDRGRRDSGRIRPGAALETGILHGRRNSRWSNLEDGCTNNRGKRAGNRRILGQEEKVGRAGGPPAQRGFDRKSGSKTSRTSQETNTRALLGLCWRVVPGRPTAEGAP